MRISYCGCEFFGADANSLVLMRILCCGCGFFVADADFSKRGAANNFDIGENS
jgi:hypothetical protein